MNNVCDQVPNATFNECIIVDPMSEKCDHVPDSELDVRLGPCCHVKVAYTTPAMRTR